MIGQKYNIKPKDFYSIPNILCYIRILLVPCFVTFYLMGVYGEEENRLTLEWMGIAAVLLASICDFADGKIARHYNQITELGKVLDPLADKIMQLAESIVVCICYDHVTGMMDMWFLLILFVVKELSQFAIIYISYRHGHYMDGAKWYGKIATFGFDVLVLVVFILITFYPHPSANVITVLRLTIVFCGLLLLFALVMYIREVFLMRKSGINNIPPSLMPHWQKKFGSKNKNNGAEKSASKGDEKND